MTELYEVGGGDTYETLRSRLIEALARIAVGLGLEDEESGWPTHNRSDIAEGVGTGPLEGLVASAENIVDALRDGTILCVPHDGDDPDGELARDVDPDAQLFYPEVVEISLEGFDLPGLKDRLDVNQREFITHERVLEMLEYVNDGKLSETDEEIKAAIDELVEQACEMKDGNLRRTAAYFQTGDALFKLADIFFILATNRITTSEMASMLLGSIPSEHDDGGKDRHYTALRTLGARISNLHRRLTCEQSSPSQKTKKGTTTYRRLIEIARIIRGPGFELPKDIEGLTRLATDIQGRYLESMRKPRTADNPQTEYIKTGEVTIKAVDAMVAIFQGLECGPADTADDETKRRIAEVLRTRVGRMFKAILPTNTDSGTPIQNAALDVPPNKQSPEPLQPAIPTPRSTSSTDATRAPKPVGSPSKKPAAAHQKSTGQRSEGLPRNLTLVASSLLDDLYNGSSRSLIEDSRTIIESYGEVSGFDDVDVKTIGVGYGYYYHDNFKPTTGQRASTASKLRQMYSMLDEDFLRGESYEEHIKNIRTALDEFIKVLEGEDPLGGPVSVPLKRNDQFAGLEFRDLQICVLIGLAHLCSAVAPKYNTGEATFAQSPTEAASS
jgi:hypothetical protein